MHKPIGQHMVKSPLVADGAFTLKQAHELMKEWNIRHLPITKDDRLIGLVSDRDVREAMALPQGQNLRISDIMKTDVFVARRSDSLRNVVRKMQKQKIGSAVVVDSNQNCVGIFTTIDALEILADMLEDEDDASSVLNFEDYVEMWRAPSPYEGLENG